MDNLGNDSFACYVVIAKGYSMVQWLGIKNAIRFLHAVPAPIVAAYISVRPPTAAEFTTNADDL